MAEPVKANIIRIVDGQDMGVIAMVEFKDNASVAGWIAAQSTPVILRHPDEIDLVFSPPSAVGKAVPVMLELLP